MTADLEGLDDLEVFIERTVVRSATRSKDELILGHVRGRSVLDLGCIDHSADTALGLGSDWLHARIVDAARDVVGLDILEEDAAILNGKGYSIAIGDAEDFDLGRTFDVVVAADLIEHLSNPGRMLEAVSRHLHDEAVFIVTTPNAFNIEQVMGALLRRQLWVNPEHAMWFDPRVAHQLVARSPLRIQEFHWIDTRFHFRIKGGRIVRRVANRFSDWAMEHRPILRRDFALVLVKR